MAKRDESYHPRLIIVNHFDALINRIDVKTEELLQEAIQNESNNSKRINDLNELREKQIEKIKQVKELNMKLFEHFNEDEYGMEWSELINNNSIVYEQNIDRIMEKIISVDCVLLEENKVLNGLDLWITNWFHNSKNLEILK